MRYQDAPLAERARPQTYHDLLGQDHVWREDSPLWNLVHKDKFHALLIWGPPGCGKTSLARVIGQTSGREMAFLSATESGVKDIRACLQLSQEKIDHGEKALVVFMDEIHRLSKSQQDVLLPPLENGTIKFIGATTENPSFEVNNAILSRALVFQFKKIPTEALVTILKRSLGLMNVGERLLRVTDEVFTALAQAAGGDARKGLNLLEAVVEAGNAEDINLATLEKIAKDIPLHYDKKGDHHYDVSSALIKSLRASHPDAALHYLARMIDGGDDPMFIARRLVIFAAEDIGNANPTALLTATSGMQAVHMVGMPEARIILSQVATYLAASPKSNRAYLAIDAALQDVKNYGALAIPFHLRNAPTAYSKTLGYGKEYIYPHDNLEGARQSTYLPAKLQGKVYYQPTTNGVEKQLKANLEQLRPTKD